MNFFKNIKLDKVKTAQSLSTVFSILALVGTIGSFFVDDICEKAAIDEAVDNRMKELEN